jgi:hypothetical protein
MADAAPPAHAPPSGPEQNAPSASGPERRTFAIRSGLYGAGRIDAAIAINSALGIEPVSVLETQ